jgi:hypothetical protein
MSAGEPWRIYMPEETLEPLGCPFCGEKPDVHKHHKDPLWSLLHRCKVIGPITIEWQSDRNGLIRVWNTRATKL